jgi:hypothetical protein
MAVVPIVMVVAVVLMVPVSFMDLPSLLVVVVVRMGPVGAGVGRPLPDAGDPDVSSAVISPVTVDPGVALSGYRRPCLIAQRWRRSADINVDLAKCRDSKDRCGEGST